MTLTTTTHANFHRDLLLDDAVAVIQWCAARNQGVRINFYDPSYNTTPGTPKLFSTDIDFNSLEDRDEFAEAFNHLV